MNLNRKIYYKTLLVPRLVSRVTEKYYAEDYIRLYPGGVVYYPFGFRRKANQNDVKNFLNYLEFYGFASQFVKDKRVADPGCSSGYSSNVLWEVGKAAVVYACDASKHAVKFARLHFCEFAEFTNQSMSDLKGYPDDCIDVAISSEVLEHIKEYQMEEKVISEIRRIVCDRGIIIVGTPKSGLLGDHGFYFDEIDGLFKKIFKQLGVTQLIFY